jgi:hypothetical protein
MSKVSQTSFLLTVLAVVMGLGGWNILAAELLLRVYQGLPKEGSVTRGQSGKSTNGENSAGAMPSSTPKSSSEPEKESHEEEVEADEIDTMYAQRELDVLQRSLNSSFLLGTQKFSADTSSFRTSFQLPIGETV